VILKLAITNQTNKSEVLGHWQHLRFSELEQLLILKLEELLYDPMFYVKIFKKLHMEHKSALDKMASINLTPGTERDKWKLPQ
jgi:hypothetical protein